MATVMQKIADIENEVCILNFFNENALKLFLFSLFLIVECGLRDFDSIHFFKICNYYPKDLYFLYSSCGHWINHRHGTIDCTLHALLWCHLKKSKFNLTLENNCRVSSRSWTYVMDNYQSQIRNSFLYIRHLH